ncbi:hypothetical protein [uncultured Roseobacter sp.]|uniref:hypothetical protein n=1 Tax=uncultured Roseobacter sp. TaxID=114847 RepID=UPI002632FB36|nr:hypothetical protein [uncultured Roseobacter sp.]
MHRTIALLVALAMPGLALAQQYDVDGMQVGLSMLELNVDRILDDHGFGNVDPTTLDLSTIVEIISIVRDDEGAASARSAIEVALKRD